VATLRSSDLHSLESRSHCPHHGRLPAWRPEWADQVLQGQLFVLPPLSPKLNGAVERAQRSHTEKFYQVTNCSLEMAALNRELREWEKTYNTVRPTNRSATSPPHDTSSSGTLTERIECVTSPLVKFSTRT